MSDDIRAAIAAAMKGATKSWKQAKRQADRDDRVSRSRIARLRKPRRVTIREVAFRGMPDAYAKASGGGKFYANARQIMYAARPAILAECDASEFDDVYFTQTLLKDYIEEFRPAWRVVWDARGHLVEPHTGTRIGLGGVEVADYTAAWRADFVELERPAVAQRVRTHGPANRFANALFIEKEGFTEILAAARVGARYDTAILSTKGVPVDAACDLIKRMTGSGVRVFVLHDFDLAGFKIVRTLKRGTRLSRGSPVIDLGLRLADVEGLESESVNYYQREPARYLRQCGATAEEIEFLVGGGRRVEINAMTSDELVAWLEQKFAEHGVAKVVPDDATLEKGYRRAVFLQRLEERVAELVDEVETDAAIPDGLADRVRSALEAEPSLSWDAAVWRIARENSEDEDS